MSRRALLVLCACAAVLAGGGVARADAGVTGTLHKYGRWLLDAQGRVVTVHGLNQADKLPPYDIESGGFTEQDAQYMQDHGFDAMRMGLDDAAIEPAAGVYDTHYLDRLADTVAMLGRHGIYVLLSSDDNCYSTDFGGQGMPSWMVQSEGLPSTTAAVGFPACYLAQDEPMNRAWDHFWANDPAPDGIGLQDHYVTGWALLARRLAGLDNVIGYDTLNEPWAGSQSALCEQPQGCQAFDAGPLTDYTVRVATAIHAAQPQAIVFGEPGLAFDFGVNSFLGDFGQSGPAGLSFHVYCLLEYQTLNAPQAPPPSANSNCSYTDGRSFSTASSLSAQDHAVPVLTEFGATDGTDILARVLAEADKQMLSWTEWTFAGRDPCCARPNEGLVYDIAKPPTPDNIKTAKELALVRPYPAAVAGTPTGWSFDPATRAFSLRYQPLSVTTTHRVADGLLTDVFVPDLQYPHGYRVTVTGGHVAAGAGTQHLQVAAEPTATSVSVTIVPA